MRVGKLRNKAGEYVLYPSVSVRVEVGYEIYRILYIAGYSGTVSLQMFGQILLFQTFSTA